MTLISTLQAQGFQAVQWESNAIIVSLNRPVTTLEVMDVVKDLGRKLTIRKIDRSVLITEETK